MTSQFKFMSSSSSSSSFHPPHRLHHPHDHDLVDSFPYFAPKLMCAHDLPIQVQASLCTRCTPWSERVKNSKYGRDMGNVEWYGLDMVNVENIVKIWWISKNMAEIWCIRMTFLRTLVGGYWAAWLHQRGHPLLLPPICHHHQRWQLEQGTVAFPQSNVKRTRRSFCSVWFDWESILNSIRISPRNFLRPVPWTDHISACLETVRR